MNPAFPIDRAISLLRRAVPQWGVPIVTQMAKSERNPFLILIATVLSLRTKDTCTAEAAARLFELASTPGGLLELDEALIARTIYPVGFYRTKARTIHTVCRLLLERHGGETPDTLEALLALPGVGRKTANLVLGQGFGIPAICVDTHVHRITNRWGYVATKTPEETEASLREILPRRHWIVINDLLVAYGQHLCVPVSPWCSRCTLSEFCPRLGVARSR